MIALHFGKQLMGSMYNEVQEWALEYELSIEDATNDCYKYMTWSLSEVNNNWQSHFDIMFSSIFKCLVEAPEVAFDVANVNSLRTPTLLLKSNYVTERYTGLKNLITTQVIDTFGVRFQDEFGLEYLGYEILKGKNIPTSSRIKNDHRSRPKNSVLYLINGESYFYDGKSFLPVISTSNLPKAH